MSAVLWVGWKGVTGLQCWSRIRKLWLLFKQVIVNEMLPFFVAVGFQIGFLAVVAAVLSRDDLDRSPQHSDQSPLMTQVVK